jgi:DNA repair exonuclease SbcCD nuclease subunit
MRRTKYHKIKDTQKPDAILCADLHLREDTPICRIDDFQQAQWKKLMYIKTLQQQFDCPVLCSGDVFQHWKPSPYLLSKIIEHLPKNFYTVYGNHDMPQHNIELIQKSGIFTLEMAGSISINIPKGMQFLSYGTLPFTENSEFFDDDILIWHKMTYHKELPYPGCKESSAIQLLKKYPRFNLIVTGDNHKPFVVNYRGRLLVNPGSMTRQRASETHKPRVYLWYAKTNSVEPIYLPCEENVISREHIEIIEKRNKRIEAFIQSIDNDIEVTINFEENLKRFEKKNNIRKTIMNIIYKAIEK